ncbi:MAG: alpha/beta fold hydrolase [Candidatus Binatia bacterium]
MDAVAASASATKTRDAFAAFYAAAAIEHHEVDDATLAVRRFGSGPAVVLIHGFPTHGYTWRFLLPQLAEHFTCYTVDLAGLGDSSWSARTDFRFTAQARRVNALLARLGIGRCAIVAHDTGATVARLVALADPERVASLALINTEMPGHRPPWIPLFCMTARLPGAALSFKPLLGSKWYLRSGMGFGAFYSDRRLFDDPTRLGPYVDPLLQSGERLRGMLGYLAGIEWNVVDGLREQHARLEGPTLLLWGEDDVTFPVAHAERMVKQFAGRATLVRIRHASLMPHEEEPDEVLNALLPFLLESLRQPGAEPTARTHPA